MSNAFPLPPDRARTMRRVATGTLVAMAALFFATLEPARDGATVWGFVHAFAEAGMIGGLADWFAVTALFRHPLGLPIPHTAIIPENKDRIANTMARFLRENFLTPAVIARRLRAFSLARAAGDWLTRDPSQAGEAAGRIGSGAGALVAELLESLDPKRLGLQVRSGLAAQLERIEVAPLLGRMLEGLIADRRHLPLIDGLIRRAGLTLEANETMVREMIRARANALLRFTGLDERVANSVIDGLYRMLAEVLVDPDHPLRGKLDEGLADLAHRLQHDPELRAKVETMKAELIANPAVAEWWMGVWERLRSGLIARIRSGEGDGLLGGEIAGMMRELGDALQRDRRLQVQIDRFARRTAVGIANRYGGQIVALVSETVRRWDARTLTDRLEGAVGRDLQFIRINGTLVGGLVGMAIHAMVLVAG